MIIEPRRGFTQKLFAAAEDYLEAPSESQPSDYDGGKFLSYSKSYPSLEEGTSDVAQPRFGYKCYEGEPQRSDFRLTVFSGPHGVGIPIGDYGKVLMIATGFGIVAQLPYPGFEIAPLSAPLSAAVMRSAVP